MGSLRADAVAVAAIPLSALPLRTPATVTDVTGAAAQEALRVRLLEIGFVPGERVMVMARGVPGGEPVAVRVGGTTFALRRHEAELIQVAPA
jgi:ferrous iron transport protein A